VAAIEVFANNPNTTVASGGTDAPAGGTVESWTVNSSSTFPTASTGSAQFHVGDPDAPTEVILVTNISGTTWTVTRGAEGSTPVAHDAGFTIYQVTTAGFLASVEVNPMTTLGDMEYAGSAGTVPVRLAGNTSATKNFLLSTGSGSAANAPSWGTMTAADINGVVTVAQGGSGTTTASAAFNVFSPMTTIGDTIYGGASGAGTRLGGNTASTRQFHTSQGSGGNATAPTWGTLVAGDIPLDQSAGDIAATSFNAAAGAVGKVPDAGHVHVQNYGGIFGTGTDGAVAMNGTNTFASFSSLSGGTYTLTRDVQSTGITISAGVTVASANYRMFARGTISNSGNISVNGNNASGAAAGAVQTSASYGGGRAGGAGGTGVSGAGAAGATANIGVTAGAGGTGNAGGAGGGGVVIMGGGAAVSNFLQAPAVALTGIGAWLDSSFVLAFGPGGGGGGSDSSSNAGGGGGGGAGIIGMFAWAITNAGTITANGGNGGNAAAGNAGGGGGGSGGLIAGYTLSSWTNTGTMSASGGSLGTGAGTGANGHAGGSSSVLNVVLG
jgi:hypothetical protein